MVLSARQQTSARASIMKLLTSVATVYVADASAAGAFVKVARAGLACRLLRPRERDQPETVERTQLATRRILWWDASYDLPERSEVEINGVRWQPLIGTFDVGRGLSLYGRCDVMRVD